jgi:hypothetical protein
VRGSEGYQTFVVGSYAVTVKQAFGSQGMQKIESFVAARQAPGYSLSSLPFAMGSEATWDQGL